MPPEDLEEWELLSPGEVELDGSTLGSEVLTQVLRRCAATSAKRTSESRECATSPSVRIFLSCAQVCRRWKRISDNHVAWPDLLRSEGVISVEGLAESWVEMEPPMQLSPQTASCSTVPSRGLERSLRRTAPPDHCGTQ